MNDFIKGNDVTIDLWQDDEEPLRAGCNTTDNINIDREFVEITNLSGNWRSYLPTYIGGSMSFDSVLFFEGLTPEQVGIQRHIGWMLYKVPLNFRVRWTSGGNTGGLDGTCYMQSLSITGAVNNYATGNFSLIITGEVTIYEDYS